MVHDSVRVSDAVAEALRVRLGVEVGVADRVAEAVAVRVGVRETLRERVAVGVVVCDAVRVGVVVCERAGGANGSPFRPEAPVSVCRYTLTLGIRQHQPINVNVQIS